MDEQKALNSIKNAWMWATFSSSVMFILFILSQVGLMDVYMNYLIIIDILMVLGLAFGVYKKSRVCAILLFIYFIIDKIIMIISQGRVTGTVWLIIAGGIYIQGIRGTFYYHKNMKDKENTSIEFY
ncbi:hypothetical protein KQI86_15570 [Clostridium sp. MSJ-11]|uniref:Uncharacterized protein n=1 Tax=Clostridium mobile TaxID=2841512 RepID=A0ABS6EMY6_9CLOT|nr:hypothetical protein [Clostridium mobile]MBU5485739.1 hypothetical protein [Clostridium mobile]